MFVFADKGYTYVLKLTTSNPRTSLSQHTILGHPQNMHLPAFSISSWQHRHLESPTLLSKLPRVPDIKWHIWNVLNKTSSNGRIRPFLRPLSVVLDKHTWSIVPGQWANSPIGKALKIEFQFHVVCASSSRSVFLLLSSSLKTPLGFVYSMFSNHVSNINNVELKKPSEARNIICKTDRLESTPGSLRDWWIRWNSISHHISVFDIVGNLKITLGVAQLNEGNKQ